jgi:phage terminase large subunit-like protein
MIGNVYAKRDAKVYPRKARNENKIDGAVGLIMALGRGSLQEDNRIFYTGLRSVG